MDGGRRPGLRRRHPRPGRAPGPRRPGAEDDRRYTDLAAREVLARLRTRGYAETDLPSERTTRDILNRMGYRLARVRKGRPVRKAADADPIFANVAAVRAAAAAPGTREVPVGTKAKVAEGRTPAGRKTRAAGDGSSAKGSDHDPPAARGWTPLGIPVVATGALSRSFGRRETSDLWADGPGR